MKCDTEKMSIYEEYNKKFIKKKGGRDFMMQNEVCFDPRVGDMEQLGTNPRTLTTTLAERGLNVKDFGAKGDGVIDETSIFNTTIQYALQNGLKSIFVPDGTFIVGDVVVPSDFTIFGTGELIKKSNANGILVLSGSNSVVNGLSLSSLNYRFETGYLVSITAKNGKVLNCKFNYRTNSKEYAGIRLEADSANTVITGNDFKNCAFMIYGVNGASNILITQNTFSGGTTKGVVEDGKLTTIPVGDAIKLSRGLGGSYVKVLNNIFDGIYRDCIDLFSCGINIDFSYNICRNIDVLVADIKTIYRDSGAKDGTSDPNNPTRDVVLSFNEISNVGLGTYDDSVIYVGHKTYRSDELYGELEFAVQRVNIFANKINSNSRYGVWINSCKNINVSKNEFRNIKERNIQMNGYCEDIDVEGNEIYLTPHTNNVYGIQNGSADSKGIRIKRNKIYGPDHAPEQDSYHSAGVIIRGIDCEVEDNYIRNVRTGISVSELEDSVVDNNKIYKCEIAGLRVGEGGLVERSIIRNNVMKDCARAILFNNTPEKIIFVNNVSNNCQRTWSNSTTLVESIDRNNDVITV